MADSSTGDPLPSSAAVDERKVETAVKFLQNPKVQATPLSRRVTFLEQKGLNKSEIDAAIARSGSVECKPDHSSDASAASPIAQHVPQQTGHHGMGRPGWSSIVVTAILGGGVAYMMNYIVKGYIAPFLVGKDKKEDLLEQLVKSTTSFEQSYTELASSLTTSFQKIEDLLQQQQIAINSVKMNNSSMTNPLADAASLSEIKSELTSMKSLLLARNQFPASPFSQTSAAPAIPAWQKAAALKKQAAQEKKLVNDATDVVEPLNGTDSNSTAKANAALETDSDTDVANIANGAVETCDEDRLTPELPLDPSLSSTYIKVE